MKLDNTIEIQYFHESGMLKTKLEFVIDLQGEWYIINNNDEYLRCENYLVWLLPLLYIPFDTFIEILKKKIEQINIDYEWAMRKFPFDSLIKTAFFFKKKTSGWAKLSIKWLNNHSLTLNDYTYVEIYHFIKNNSQGFDVEFKNQVFEIIVNKHPKLPPLA